MIHNRAAPKLLFAGGFKERDAQEAEARGYRSHVFVELSDGKRYPLTFYDPVRFQQDLEEVSQLGSDYIAEPGLVVVPEVTPARMHAAVSRLEQEGYFNALVAVAEGDVELQSPQTNLQP